MKKVSFFPRMRLLYLTSPGLRRMILLEMILLEMLLFGLLLGGLLLSQMPVFAAQSEWLLVQKHEARITLTIRLSEKAFRAEMEPQGCVILARHPDWQVHCFRPKEKVEWIGQIKDFSSILMTNPYVVSKPVVRFTLPSSYVTERQFGAKTRIYNTKTSSIVVADEIKVGPEVSEIYSRLVGTPFFDGIPFYFEYFAKGHSISAKSKGNWINTSIADDTRRGKIVRLITLSCKKVPYNSQDFQLPKGFERKVDLVDVSYSPGDRAQISDFLDNVGFESRLDDRKTEKSRERR
ncbi:MAG: hypothetical protein K2Y32_20810 [Candidatus Obscuribacterales bacterium]|nr:hypothetical protein [Candidatus Obscuribacterales bacterium]